MKYFEKASLAVLLNKGLGRSLADCLNRELQLLKDYEENKIENYVLAVNDFLPEMPHHVELLSTQSIERERCKVDDLTSVSSLISYIHKPLSELYRYFNRKTKPLNLFTSVYLRSIYFASENYFSNEILGRGHMELIEGKLEPRIGANYLLSTSILKVILARMPVALHEKVLNPKIAIRIMFRIGKYKSQDLIETLTRFSDEFNLKKVICESLAKWTPFVTVLKSVRVLDIVTSINYILESWSRGVLTLEELILTEFVNCLRLTFTNLHENKDSMIEFFTSFLRVNEVENHLRCDMKSFKRLTDLLKGMLAYIFKAGKYFKSRKKYHENEIEYQYEMFSEQLNSTLTTLKIMYNWNDTWHRWFDHFNAPHLVEKCDFICNDIIEEFNNDVWLIEQQLSETDLLLTYMNMAKTCPAILPHSIRLNIFEKTVKNLWNKKSHSKKYMMTIPRNDALNGFKNLFGQFYDARYEKWQLNFENETGTGAGPTKEAYTLMSHELQKFHLDIWFGEPTLSFPNVKDFRVKETFVYSSSGLYPKPGKIDELSFLGTLMAKALLDGAVLDIPFNIEFYRQLSCDTLSKPKFSYHQVPTILPMTSIFVEQLLLVKRKKSIILSQPSLTMEDKQSLVEKLEFQNNCTFEDLAISFTIPGTDIELMDGGKNVMLSSLNIDEYLERLGQKMISDDIFSPFVEGFLNVIEHHHLDMFLPDELESLFCGSRLEPWNVDELKLHVKFINGFTAESRTVGYLLETLASFNTYEQRLFLQFVTGRPRLSCGGLANLKPLLTVSLDRSPEGNHDDRLPSAATCINLINLPEYSSREITKKKLVYAMTECNSYEFV